MAIPEQFNIGLDVNSLDEIESALASIHANRGFDLAISATALDKRRGALRDASMLQALQTWARLSGESTLRLPSRMEADPLVEACGYSVGIGALSLAPNISVGGNRVTRAQALSASTQRMNAAYEGRLDDLVKGQNVDLISVSGAQRQFLKPLFDRPHPKGLKDNFGLRATVRGLAIKAYPTALEYLDERLINALATLTHELVENTQEHAVSDEKLQPYRRHITSLFASRVAIADQDTQNDLLANETLKSYWAWLSQSQPGRKSPAGLCFSFLDSGPGMAARLLGKQYIEMSLDDESKALRECLKLHVSTKDLEGTGGGLMEVLTEVAEMNGLVRIRSGRLSIFRCFAPDVDGELYEHFEDWYPARVELSRVVGTQVNIFIPLFKAFD